MLRAPHADAGHVAGAMGQDAAAVHAQLAKVLGSPHFRNSKRSQALVRYVVEGALAGDQTPLKERCIGAAVFGRETAYDTAQDPIVRNAAIEVRKRLAQYYLEPEHAGELRFELPIGSYLPTFTIESPPAEPQVAPAASRRPALKWVLAALTLSMLGATAAVLWSTVRTPTSELEAFWEPLFRDRKEIQICIGQPTRVYRFTGPRTEEINHLLAGPPSPARKTANLSIAGEEVAWVAPEYLFMRDALAAFKVGSWIQSKGRAYQMMSVAQTNYSQLRHAPLVAIGAFNNAWAMRVTGELRFVFDQRMIDGAGYHCIIDRRDSKAAKWKVMQPAGA